MTGSTYLDRIESRLRSGEHLCAFYENKMEQFRMALPFIERGLALGEKCLYIADENTVAEIKAGLLMHGVDVERHLSSAQLAILTKRESYLRLGAFDPKAMISFWDAAINEALRQGYPGLRATGEASWILQDLSSTEVFWEYEAMLNAGFGDRPVKILCQYNTKRFFGDIVVRALRTHPRVLLGLDLYENPFCEPITPARRTKVRQAT